MASCDFCKVEPKEPLKSCVCKKVFYCSKECQVKDWKTHKPSCPPFVIRESSGKYTDPMSLYEFKTIHYPHMDEKTKSVILQLHDPAENIKNLDRKTLKELNRKDPILLRHYKEAKSDKMNKIFRIIQGNRITICDSPALYSDYEYGLYSNIVRINHSRPITIPSWMKRPRRRFSRSTTRLRVSRLWTVKLWKTWPARFP